MIDELETYIDSEYANYVESYRKTRAIIDAGTASGLMLVRVKLEELKSQSCDQMTPQRRQQIEQIANQYGPPNCWTGTTGTLAAIIRELLTELDKVKNDAV